MEKVKWRKNVSKELDVLARRPFPFLVHASGSTVDLLFYPFTLLPDTRSFRNRDGAPTCRNGNGGERKRDFPFTTGGARGVIRHRYPSPSLPLQRHAALRSFNLIVPHFLYTPRPSIFNIFSRDYRESNARCRARGEIFIL